MVVGEVDWGNHDDGVDSDAEEVGWGPGGCVVGLFVCGFGDGPHGVVIA